MAAPSTSSYMALETIGPGGAPPKTRLSSAKEAQNIFAQLRVSAKDRLNRARIIQGMFDGNPPYNPQKMRQQGQAWSANFNTLEGAARKESAKTPYYDLFSSASLYAECSTEVATPSMDAATATRIRSEEFDRMLRSFADFDSEMWVLIDDMIAFNRGFLYWPDPESWHFEQIPWHKVYFPDGTKLKKKRWGEFAIEHEWSVHELYKMVRDEGAARAAGWNIDQVYKAIRAAVPTSVVSNYDDPMAVQNALRDSELFISCSSDVIHAASIFFKEFDGSWSRMIVVVDGEHQSGRDATAAQSPLEAAERQQGKRGGSSKLQANDWLSFKQKLGDDLHEILCPFVYEPGNGSINSIDGFGKRIGTIMQVKDRMRNTQVDNVLLGMNILLQSQNGASQAKGATIMIQKGVTVLPTGFNALASNIIGDVSRTLEVNADLDRMLDTNTGTYRPQFEKPTGNPESATAANIRFSQSTVLTNSAVNRFYVQLDRFYTEAYRRASAELPDSPHDEGVTSARDFQKRCRDRGLSDKQIRDLAPNAIRATRTIGNGSPGMRQQVAQNLIPIVQLLGPRGLQEFKVMYVSAWGGQQAVQRLLPKEDTAQVPTRDAYDAVGENADAQTGAPVLFADWQDHEEHSKLHLEAAVGAIQSVQQGADPAMPLVFLQVMLPHIAQHVAKVGRETIQKQLQQLLQQVQQGARTVEQAAQQQAQQRQQQNQLSFEQQLAMQETQGKLQIQAAKTQAGTQMKAQKQQAEMAMREKQFKQEAALRDASVSQEITTSTAKTVAEIENQKAKTEAAVEAAKNKPKPTASK